MQEQWIKHPTTPWIERFRSNPDSASDGQAKAIAVDRGQLMPHGQPPLLRTRKMLTLQQAQELWISRLQTGWEPIEPQW